MFYFDVFIVVEANAASVVCHQRNAISGRGACIFVLTHFFERETEPTASSAVQNITERCQEADRSG
jgi:nitrate reductase cytochrome c-type subunit